MARKVWTTDDAAKEHEKQMNRASKLAAKSSKLREKIEALKSQMWLADKEMREALVEEGHARNRMRLALCRCQDCDAYLYGRDGMSRYVDEDGAYSGVYCVLDPATGERVSPDRYRCKPCQDKALSDPTLVDTCRNAKRWEV